MKTIAAILTLFILMVFSKMEDKRYVENYYDNGTLASEGWMRFNVKTDYWIFYHPNGKKSEQGSFAYGKKEKYWYYFDEDRIRTKEGHYLKDEQVGWWLFYDKKGRINHKCQLVNGIENGYCLKYKDSKIISAEKYSQGKKIKEWFNFRAFRKDNSISDLK